MSYWPIPSLHLSHDTPIMASKTEATFKQLSPALVRPYNLGRLPLDIFGAALSIAVVLYDFGMNWWVWSHLWFETKENNVAHTYTLVSQRRMLYFCWRQQLLSTETYTLQVWETQKTVIKPKSQFGSCGKGAFVFSQKKNMCACVCVRVHACAHVLSVSSGGCTSCQSRFKRARVTKAKCESIFGHRQRTKKMKW